jgi:demethylmenaquinone methyltransferase/2-methoxy-6-polyprenyl-1,4-benzoquinol methylase
MFGEIAPHYDRMNHLLSMNVDRWWRRVAVRRLRPKPGSHILDACTGTGDLAFAFERRLNGQATIVATDFCPEMLDIARQKAPHDSRIEFRQADTLHLPFEDNRFDIVSVAFGLRNVEDTIGGLKELVRVCKPGGRVGILEFSTPRRWPVRPLYRWYFRNVLPRIGQALARNSANAYSYLPESVGEFPAWERLVALMKDAGMQDAGFESLTFGIATLYIGRK